MKRSFVDTATTTKTALDSSIVNKPVFLTKVHREELALKHRQDEIANQRRRLAQTTRSDLETDDNRDGNRNRGRDSDKSRDRDRESREQERRNRDREREEKSAKLEREKELNAMKEQYLGGSTKPKKRVIRPSEKFRFSFDWEITEDTSQGGNTNYEAQLLFGRGFRAGIDRREQKKLSAKHESATRGNENRRKNTSVDDKHWSENVKLEKMTERDWRIFKEDFNISYKGSKIPPPMRNWEESKLSPELLKAVERADYKKPRPIQMAAIPLGLQQRDVIGIAETGTGKTAAFVLPMLAYISKLPKMSEETQTEGGGSETVEEQGFTLSKGCEIVIATPGRLLDLLERRYVVLNQCNYVVLDEADRMIDLGFEPQVAAVLEAIPSSNLKPEKEDEELDEKKVYRTTYMFSATMPYRVKKLAKKFLRNPVEVTVSKSQDLISQKVMMVRESEKFWNLKKLIGELGGDETAMVFVSTQKKVESIVKNLEKLGTCRVATLHGGKSQEQRDTSLGGFKSKRFNVLVATDIASRGIDAEVAHVINYDMAKDIETYTHRIGRTGRAGKTGVATTFLTLEDKNVFYDLKRKLVECNSPVPPQLARHEASKVKPGTFKSQW
ncbi:unnamed protein product [Microthlaspi erraticum]|uniref:RNA helicase n=1 Tax=Microthlaspi erraticum TaxID=1685480 RepID=A0A6D2HNP9_9BRAS|nr:unnamed protein product [Microthlaspi erraticum]